MSQCNATFDRIASELGGFTCRDAPAVLHLRNPFALTNWTLPVLEAMMVFGAILALWWAIRRMRRDGDPTNLALWAGSIVYLLVTEIPLYFPDAFGIEDRIGVVFDHNVFTVQFLYERLPLYIVALYPAVTTLAFEIVRSLGVFARHGIVIGSVCVGFVHHCLYEVFDHSGPTLRWWAWNPDNPLNRPMFGPVPMTSLVIFATLGPAVLTYLTMALVGRPVAKGRHLNALGIAWRSVLAGSLVIVGVAVVSLPESLFGGTHPNVTAQAVVFACYLVVFAVIGVVVLARRWLAVRRHPNPDRPTVNPVIRVFGPLYLAVLVSCWIAGPPGWYAYVGLLFAALATAAAWTAVDVDPALQRRPELSRSL